MSGTIFLETSEISVSETNGQVFVTIVRTGDVSGPVTVSYGITSNTATAGSDYVGGTGTVTMAPGQTRLQVPIQIVNDMLSETTEAFTFSIINVDSESTLLFPRTARIDILDDENPSTYEPAASKRRRLIIIEVEMHGPRSCTQRATLTPRNA